MGAGGWTSGPEDLGADEAGDGVGGFGESFFSFRPVGLSCTDDAVAHMVIEKAQRDVVQS